MILHPSGRTENSGGLAPRLQVKAGPGHLISLVGYNNGPAQFVQFHNAASSPSDGAIPIFAFAIDAGATFTIDTPVWFSAGISICNSTTLETLTAGASDCWFMAQVN